MSDPISSPIENESNFPCEQKTDIVMQDEDSDSIQMISSSLPSSQAMESESDVIMADEGKSEADDCNSSQLMSSSQLNDIAVSTSDAMNKSNSETSVPKVKLTKEQREAERKRRQEEKRLAEEEKQRKRLEREKAWEEKRLEKLEKKRLWEEQVKKREEKKRLEEEEKNKKLEEKKRLEEEKQKHLDEQEKKKKMVAEKFIGFFQKQTSKTNLSVDETGDLSATTGSNQNSKFFGTYHLQKNETLATLVPKISRDNFVMGAFDSMFAHQDEQRLYLQELQNKSRKPFVYRKSNDSLDLMNQEDEEDKTDVEPSEPIGKVYRAKLFQFGENIRPAYFGTWRKKSKRVNGRRPFAKDSDQFDYEIDSDDEWEEEEKGESIRDSDSEQSDTEEANDYELDEFFVPHGHLSDDENQEEDIADVELMPDGQKKRKLLTKEKILIEERTKKLKRLVPKTVGCLWMNQDGFENKAKFRDFEKYRVVFMNES